VSFVFGAEPEGRAVGHGR